MTGENKELSLLLRSVIKDDLRSAKMLWDDTRPSSLQNIELVPGLTVTGIRVTPQSIREMAESHEKVAVMEPIIDAMVLLNPTNGFKNMLLTFFSDQYDLGIPVDEVFYFLEVDLENDSLGPFEQDKLNQSEEKFLDLSLRSVLSRILKRYPVEIRDKNDESASANGLAMMVSRSFTSSKTGQWISQAQLEGDIRFTLLQKDLQKIKEYMEWVRQFAQRYQDPTFNHLADLLGPTLTYLE